MIKKMLFVCLTLLTSNFLQSQIVTGKDTNLTFKVVALKTIVKITPNNDELTIGWRNSIKISISGAGKITKVILNGGSITTGKDSIYTAFVSEGTQAILTVYTQIPGKEEKLSLTKVYKIIKAPVPEIFVSGVKSDSSIYRISLIALGNITAFMPVSKKQIPVLLFNMLYTNLDSARIDTLNAAGGKFTKEMKKCIAKMKDGSMVTFVNVKCLMPDGSVYTCKPVRIYIIKDPPVNKLGF